MDMKGSLYKHTYVLYFYSLILNSTAVHPNQKRIPHSPASSTL